MGARNRWLRRRSRRTAGSRKMLRRSSAQPGTPRRKARWRRERPRQPRPRLSAATRLRSDPSRGLPDLTHVARREGTVVFERHAELAPELVEEREARHAGGDEARVPRAVIDGLNAYAAVHGVGAEAHTEEKLR